MSDPINALDRGFTAALLELAAQEGVDAVTTALGKVETSGPLDTALLVMLAKAVDENGVDGLKAAVGYARRLSDKKSGDSALAKVGDIPLAEASDLLAAYQKAERSDQKKLRVAARVAGHLTKPFIKALVGTLLAL